MPASCCRSVRYWFAFGQNAPKGLWLHSEVMAFGIVVQGFLLLAFRVPAHAACARRTAAGRGGHLRLLVALDMLDRSPGLFRTILEFRPLRQMGVWSFSLYLWQQPFYLLDFDVVPPLLALAGSLAVGIAAFYLVENPARTWLNRVLTQKIEIPPDEDDVPMPQP